MKREDIFAKPKKSKRDWVLIALDYYTPKNKGVTQKEYARRNNINYKTFNNSINRYKEDIVVALNNITARNGQQGKPIEGDVRKPMSIADQFLSSYKSNRNIISTRKSLRWFNDTLKKTLGGREKRLSSPMSMGQGKLYTYAYDPLTKDKLPYWDQYPLIIFLSMEYGETTKRVYFRGINLHYLSPNERVGLMHELLTNRASTSNLMKNTRLNVSWEDFEHHPKSADIIKNYLPTHIRSTIREIPPSDWLNIISLPMQKFTNEFGSGEELKL